MKGKSVFVIGILLVFCLVSCTGKSALVGKWVEEDGEIELEFFKDGSLIFKEGDDEEYKGTWTASENGQLTLKFEGETESFDYKISGSELNLDNGDVILKRKK
jgi:hypothetical protein